MEQNYRNKYQPLNEEQAKLLVQITMAEMQGKGPVDVPESDYPFLSMVVKKRIEVMKLPVKFSPHALFAINCFCDRPGSAVVLLIDVLNRCTAPEAYQDWLAKKEPKKIWDVTVGDLCEVYPWGFYTEEALMDLIDNTMKFHKPDTREDLDAVRAGTFNKKPKISWAELY